MAHILTVEDQPATQLATQHVLALAGHHVTLAANGVEGVRKALATAPDLVTLDVSMPYLNGPQTARVLNLLRYQVPVFFLSDEDDVTHLVGRYPNVAGAMAKRHQVAHLAEQVAQVLSTHKAAYTDVTFPVPTRDLWYLMSLPGRRRLLLVDDDPEVLGVLAEVLGQTGLYEVYTAKDGQEGIIKAAMLEPGLILSDVKMPNIDGITLAQLLYVIGRPIPLAYLSGALDHDTVRQAMRLEGVRGYLSKADFLRDPTPFLQRLEEWMHILPGEKKWLQSAYGEVDLEKLATSGGERPLFTSP